MNKCYAILCLCEELKNGKLIYMEEVLTEYKISEPTFRRYVATLRNFFCEQYGEEIKYFPSLKAYGVVGRYKD